MVLCECELTSISILTLAAGVMIGFLAILAADAVKEEAPAGGPCGAAIAEAGFPLVLNLLEKRPAMMCFVGCFLQFCISPFLETVFRL